ncbi:MAG: flagellar biosynthesis protein FlhB [Kordiimonas sp.]|mgnify:CR=1 FL=1|nr:flagellar biosynthesis protein FlhB [Kordiimonas sp.]|tara:strand:+ start:2768 stop:3880 length:1113 start_codon:yes stop_codon:yes gene_type:complete
MADDQDQSQKTEEPTQKKLDDAFEKGEVAKSQEVNHFFVLLAIALVLLMSAAPAMGKLKIRFAEFFEFSHLFTMEADNVREILSALMADVGVVMALPMLLLLIGGLAGATLQHKPVFTTEKILPKLNKISPIAGFKRLFSARSFVEFLKTIAKFVIVSAVVIILVWPEKNRLEQLMSYPLSDLMMMIHEMVLRMVGGVLAIMAIIAGLDYLFQRYQFTQRLRMSKQEIKDEHKQTEGDPQIKARLRQVRLERSRQRMMAAVPEADVVVTNPTHYAVALKYDPETMSVPKVVAKGADNIALKMRQLALEHEVPLLENPPLARAIYGTVEIEEEILPGHYKAVAEVIGYVMKLKRGEHATYKATSPIEPEET